MSYKLDDLYEAIANSKKVIGRFTMSDEREHGSGAVYFSSSTGKIRQVYASPHWEVENFDTIIEASTDSQIAYQLEEYDAAGDYVGNCGADSIPFALTGDLQADLDAYFRAMESYLSTLA